LILPLQRWDRIARIFIWVDICKRKIAERKDRECGNDLHSGGSKMNV